MSSLFKLSFPDFPPVFPFFTQMQLQLSWPWTSAESFKCASNMCQTFDPCLSSRSYRFSQYKKYLMYLNEWQWILKLPWQMSSDPSVKYFFTLYLSVFFSRSVLSAPCTLQIVFFLFLVPQKSRARYIIFIIRVGAKERWCLSEGQSKVWKKNQF